MRPGAVLVPAAARVGPDGRAVGVDLSPEMVRLARERVDAAGVVAELRVMDAEHLDVPDASFASVLCGFGIFFLPDPERAVGGFHRALVPGGSVGLSTWGAEDERWAWEDELLADVVVERRAVQRPFDRAGDLDALLRGAGFEDVDRARPNSTRCTSPTPTSGGRGSGRTACAGSSNSCPKPGSSACAPKPQNESRRWPATMGSRSGSRRSLPSGDGAR